MEFKTISSTKFTLIIFFFFKLTLGVPVEPDVYITMAVSSGVGEAVVVSPFTSTGIEERMFAP